MSTTVTPDAVEGDNPTTPTPEPAQAPKPKAAPKRSTAKKGTATKRKAAKPKITTSKARGPRAKRDAEHPWLADAVKAARHLSGMKPGAGGDATVAYAG